ncbi:uncharacterized protein C8Q71DRAFT_858237 [Rhodofomes roseus]|uniref:Uncharacterized protein n=1 Tax=Rhodofomes roseus TaxID=34475 RepID=A0ABQ8KG20_9APHY|nr:uncharacterized protein C8Q71DRAFT_858237 [Rhodofomes roseus]KAH9836236.1 hypothetical protein C8Q71DRAFT_858237 [Rhodofomes roseus]
MFQTAAYLAELLEAMLTLGLYRGLTMFGQSELSYEYPGTVSAVNTPLGIEDKPAHTAAGHVTQLLRVGVGHSSRTRRTEVIVRRIWCTRQVWGINVIVKTTADVHLDLVVYDQVRLWSKYANEPRAGKLWFTHSTSATRTAALFLEVVNID